MKIFYRKEQTAKKQDSFSPSSVKPAKVVERWLALDPTAQIVRSEPLTREDISLAHARAYVDGVLDSNIENGFGNLSNNVASTLPYTTGSMFAAAHHAWSTRESCASPTSGFHHAGYDYGGGFCTFNGLMIAAQKLHRLGCKRVGILDLDRHYGNGTDDIIHKLGLKYIRHYTFGAHDIKRRAAGAWVSSLPGIVKVFADCEVVLYQAGADPHVDDPLGGILTTVQMYDRDVIVFRTLKELGIPVAWNLAGGYQTPLEKVLTLHDNTLAAFCT